MNTCLECGTSFDLGEAQSEYNAEFRGNPPWEEFHSAGELCGSCAINQDIGAMNQGMAIDMMNGDEDYDADHVEKYL